MHKKAFCIMCIFLITDWVCFASQEEEEAEPEPEED